MMNEEESIERLHSEIKEQCRQLEIDYQIIFVDDGSTDSTWEVAQEIVNKDSSTEAIRFRRNFGKAAALSAGFEKCRGEIVFTMDADLQDDPNEIPKFLEKLDSGLDVVSGWKKTRHDPWHKVGPSRVFNALVSSLTKVKLHDHNCGFKAYRREIFNEVTLYGELHRFVPVLASSRGWKVGEIEVLHHAREFGSSKYGVTRIVKGFLDLITVYFLTGYTGRPLHLVGTMGLLSFAGGGLSMLYLCLTWLWSRRDSDSLNDVHLHSSPYFYFCILAVLLGVQLMMAGLLAELIVSKTSNARQFFSVAERIGGDSPGESSE